MYKMTGSLPGTSSLTKNSSRNNRWIYVLTLLFLANFMNYMDRVLVSAFAEEIKRDLAISDTQIGLLSGFAFAILYGLMAIPIAHFSDKGNRRNIIALCISIWSVMTSLTGFAQNFMQMFLTRVGVGVGEAGLYPAALSIISDSVSRNKRATAISIFISGGAIGSALGFMLAAQIAESYGYRMAFIVLGLPGLILALLIRFTMKEPSRQAPAPEDMQASKKVSLRLIWSNKALRHVLIAFPFASFVAYGTGAWGPAFFIRVHGLNLTDISLTFGPILGAAAIVGTLLGGKLTDHLSQRNERWAALVPSLALLISMPIFTAAFLATNYQTSIIIFFFGNLIIGGVTSPAMSLIQTLSPADTRARIMALAMLLSSLLGIGLAPVVIGMVSDFLEPSYGINSLRYALVFCLAFGLVSAYQFYQTSRFIKES